MICPNCSEEMVHLTRHGVTLDRCGACGGVWLDHGELDAIASALQSPVVLGDPEPVVVNRIVREAPQRDAAHIARPGRGKRWPEESGAKRAKPSKRAYPKDKRRRKNRIKDILEEIFD
nr:zf-TFIIB domain-containing protein [Maritimibacter sp. DP1N21-5]